MRKITNRDVREEVRKEGIEIKDSRTKEKRGRLVKLKKRGMKGGRCSYLG